MAEVLLLAVVLEDCDELEFALLFCFAAEDALGCAVPDCVPEVVALLLVLDVAAGLDAVGEVELAFPVAC